MYIYGLQKRLIREGLTEQESYGAIINYAIGNGNDNYSRALSGNIPVEQLKKDKIVTKITGEKIRILINKKLTLNHGQKEVNINKLQELGVKAANIDERNIDKALEIVEGYNFESAIGRNITLEEKKALIQSLLQNKVLSSEGRTLYIGGLQNKLIDLGLTQQETYAAIINYSLGNYTSALNGKTLINEGNIITTITNKTVKEAMFQNGIKMEENHKKLQILGIEAGEIHERNIDTALEIIEGYDFENAIGRNITLNEKKALIHTLLNNKSLNISKIPNSSPLYISGLQKKLINAGLTEQESYGAIINYAIGSGNIGYTQALGSRILIDETTRDSISTEVTIGKIFLAIKKQEILSEERIRENNRKLSELQIVPGEVHTRNIDTALEIVEGYDFESAIGRDITQEEKKTLIQALIGNKVLNKDRGTNISTVYIYSLKKKLIIAGLTEQESYGAIINYAIGNGNTGYSQALKDLREETNREEIVIDVTKEAFSSCLKKKKVIDNKQKESNINVLQNMGIEAGEVDEKNIDTAIQIVSGYDFESAIGRNITQEEKKALIESLIYNKSLYRGTNRYIIGLQKKLIKAGLTEQESYGAIINYSLENYTYALNGKTKINEATRTSIDIEITEEKILEAVGKSPLNEQKIQENMAKLRAAGIEALGIEAKNIDSALKIVENYDFKNSLGRTLNEQEQKVILELLIGGGALKGKSIYIATLSKELQKKGLGINETYGAIINYAVGNGNYSDALRLAKSFKETDKEQIVTEVTEETLTKATIKHQKMALKRARACVSKQTVARKDETLEKLNGLVVEVEAQSVTQKE